MTSIDSAQYISMYGPTKGDLIRLADTSLFAEIEHDYSARGDEIILGGGKTLRDGEGIAGESTYDDGCLDAVIAGATVIDAVLGVVKGDIGIRDGLIVGVGRAGNPRVMPGVDPRLVIGNATSIIAGDGVIVTAGAIEAHAHIQSQEQAAQAMSGGMTTLIGSGSPAYVLDTGSGTVPNMAMFLRSTSGTPVNFGVLGRGSSDPRAVVASVAGGALSVKVHEDFGASPAVIDGSLRAADAHDFSVHLHTDSINEFGFAEDTMDAIAGRTIHMYHVEGAGGGHAPDLLRVCSYPNVIPSSTNPTNPYTPATLDEGLPMAMLGHNLRFDSAVDLAFGEARIRAQSMAAEDYLHDIGAISIFATDTQGMGRLAENVAKCWQLASVMKDRHGRLPEERGAGDNERIKRYVAKLTINPAIAAGIQDYVGSIEPGKFADLVLWPRASFGIKPIAVMKRGFVAWAALGDANGSLPLSEPVVQRPNFGAFGDAAARLGAIFASQVAFDDGVVERLQTDKPVLPIRSTRALTKHDMVHNDALPEIEVDPRSFLVRVDGEEIPPTPVHEVPLARRHLLR
ncbi:urease subunit alpha [Agromyces aerolatus]|uniref:urease subunit alpha n=1 Tax=Agromyces sp. LY-1074 TaxID=3074080 RepID=UPI0028628FE9|nr:MULTISPECIES: urease subunit alpha [unclassified Agromyces]MDR5700886.1 urease subunit alpha [Agromyces sp. LY-1074]MDR5707453.1 urease subunit alpha [Agromyces sp. LY-1358]